MFPALALAGELMRCGAELVWAGVGGLEERVARDGGIRFERVPAAPLSGRGAADRLRWPGVLLRGLAASRRVMRRHRPDAVVAAGGYVSAAPLLWARLAGVPFFLLEQNRVPGRVTRAFAPAARECFLTFPLERPTGWRCAVTGSPLRPALAAGSRADDGRTVLVLGGSGGARALNLAALDAARALADLRFIVVTGRRDYELVKSRGTPDNCELVEFTEHPEELYHRATIAISRAGGMVLSELVAFGIPAILIPFQYATDNHQDANARHMVEAGAAIKLDQDHLSGITDSVRELMDDPQRRVRMSGAARRAARPDAARVVAERIMACSAA